MARIMIALSIALCIGLLTAGQILADTQAPAPSSSSESFRAATPIPTWTPRPTRTPMPTIACPLPLTTTIVLTYSATYYEQENILLQAVSVVTPALEVYSSTMGQAISGVVGLRTLLGLSSGGGDLPGGEEGGPYQGLGMVGMASEVISGTATTLTWLRAVGQLSITGLAIDFLLLSLAFILIVVAFKALVKLIMMLINFAAQLGGVVMKFIIPFL